MAKSKTKQQSTAADADQLAAPLPKGAVVDAVDDRIFVPVEPVSSDGEAVQSTDTVAEVLAGNYSEGIVDEVRFSILCACASNPQHHMQQKWCRKDE